jgi:hypothetical protein
MDKATLEIINNVPYAVLSDGRKVKYADIMAYNNPGMQYDDVTLDVIAATPASAEAGMMPGGEAAPDTFGDTTSRMASPYFETAADLASTAGRRPTYFQNPLMQGLERTGQYIGDMGLAGVNAAMGGVYGGAGLLGEAFGGDTSNERRLARDLAAMIDTAGPAPEGRMLGLLGDAAAANRVPAARADFLADESGALRLYHGSPHNFDRFSTQNMYGGAGRQAYGRGLYFAENEDVAKAFRALNASTAKIKHDNKTIRGENQRLAAYYIGKNNGDKDAAIRDYTNVWKPKSAKDPGLLAFEKLDPSNLRLGNMYEVDVNANPADFMDWDAAMSAQPMTVQNALSPMVTSRLDMLEEAGQRAREAAVAKGLPDFTPKSRDRLYQEMRGGDIIGASRMGQLPGEVENMLSGAGVPGIRYLDDGTVGGGKGSRNYVVFDENLINIVRKYGVAGAAAMLGMSQADVAQAMQQQQQPQGLLSMGAQ